MQRRACRVPAAIFPVSEVSLFCNILQITGAEHAITTEAGRARESGGARERAHLAGGPAHRSSSRSHRMWERECIWVDLHHVHRTVRLQKSRHWNRGYVDRLSLYIERRRDDFPTSRCSPARIARLDYRLVCCRRLWSTRKWGVVQAMRQVSRSPAGGLR